MSASDRVAAEQPLARLVREAAGQISRVTAGEAHAIAGAGAGAGSGAVIVDIRSQDARERLGVIPGSLHIPRTVLEWRVALESPWRNPYLAGPDQQLILVCDHGYSSVLAAANLVRLGFGATGDVIGGFASWAAHGLPIAPCPPGPAAVDGLPGMGPAC